VCQYGGRVNLCKAQQILKIFSPKYWAFDESLQQCRDFVCGKHQTGNSQLIDVCQRLGVFGNNFKDIE
jgi:hypothetical protein